MNFLAPYMIWIKLGLIGIAVAGAAYLAWDYRGALNEREKVEAVNKATEEIQKELNHERTLTSLYRNLADDKLTQLLTKIGDIKITNKTINTTILQEVDSNPQFYSQPLPVKGYEQWLKARSLVSPPALPASSPQR